MRKFAILLSGGVMPSANYPRYLNDLREIYLTLVGRYGFAKEDIYTLYADGSFQDLDGDGKSEVNWPGTGGHLTLVTQALLPPRITGDDLLFFFATNHGRAVDAAASTAGIWLWHFDWAAGKFGWMRDQEVIRLLQFSRFRYLVVCLGQCNSGGFVDDLARVPNCVAATACRHDEPSWACDSEGDYDEFLYHWTAAVRGSAPNGVAVDADRNGDGRISLREAFLYASGRDSRPETPQYLETAPGLGDRLTLGGPIG